MHVLPQMILSYPMRRVYRDSRRQMYAWLGRELRQRDFTMRLYIISSSWQQERMLVSRLLRATRARVWRQLRAMARTENIELRDSYFRFTKKRTK